MDKTRRVAGRTVALIPLWIAASAITFLMIHSVPGGPFDTGAIRSEETRANLNRMYGLDEPLPTQYIRYIGGAFRGDLGESMITRDQDVSEIIGERFPISALLGGLALTTALCIGIPAGLLSAHFSRSPIDYTLIGVATFGYAIPNFVLSIILLLVFGLGLGWLPAGGWGSPAQVVLPALALGLPWAGLMARMTRAVTLDELGRGYVRAAIARGAGPVRVVVAHAFRNGILPIVAVMGVMAADILVGSLVVERIFSVPGLGSYLTTAVLSSDYTVIMGLVLFYSTIVFGANIMADVAQSLLQPGGQD